jgi:Xaa-Pro aminopeptidase
MQGVLRMLPACCAAIAGIRHAPSLRTGGSRAALISMRGGSSATDDLRLSLLREELVAAGLHALVVPSGDAHLGEYVHPCYERRAFISGFTGSAGTVLVTREEALLWTDGRYFLQAEKELSDEWTLMRMNQEAVPTLEDWLSANLPEGGLLGIDPYVHSIADAEKLQAAVRKVEGAALQSLPSNLVDSVWAHYKEEGAVGEAAARPPLPSGAARVLPLAVAGRSAAEKLAAVRSAAAAAGAQAYLAVALDEVAWPLNPSPSPSPSPNPSPVAWLLNSSPSPSPTPNPTPAPNQVAWLLNLRGSDVPCCPLLQAYVLVEAEGARLFVDAAKLPAAVLEALRACNVTTAPYAEAEAAVHALREGGGKVLLDPSLCNFGLRSAAAAAAVLAPSPVTLPKASKNEAELAHMLEAHLRDGAALAHGFGWLWRSVAAEGRELTEVAVSERLRACRAQQPGFLDVSFPTIAGSGANGAIIHYNCEAVAASTGTSGTVDRRDR